MVGKVLDLSCVSPERLRMKYVAEEEKIVEEEEEKRKVNISLMKCSSVANPVWL